MGETPAFGPGRIRQNAIYRAGALGRRPRVPTDPNGLERAARRAMSGDAWAYVAGGAGDGATMRANRAAFDRWALVPRMLRDVSSRDLSVSLLGMRLPAPLLVAPIGAAGLVRRGADEMVGAAATAVGLPYILSSQGSSPMEATARAMGEGTRWYQLYWSTDEALVDSFIGRAEAMGASALVVTLDTTMLGWRPQDLNRGSLPFARGIGIAQYTSDPRFRELVRERVAAGAGLSAPRPRPTPGALRTLASMARELPGGFVDNVRSPHTRAAVETFLAIYSKPSLSWDDLATLRSRTRLPVLLKGILHPDDALRAVELGVAGLLVSNHGGRQVDGAIGALDALVDVVAALGGAGSTSVPVILDSGVRSGVDIVKALALGAAAVTVGRPHVYGLALDGSAGVQAVLDNLVAELDLTLGLIGMRSIAELSPAALRRI
ncbi:MAG TPA: alpha-hydroxy-acid oxidizing protein [Lapillicoccus sp.]|uniref:alpha-hydroxy-acid oxidizing protein n=1 Tax=Lapillicoccus sp. TaxID=1909287 RepID=UPI002F94170E